MAYIDRANILIGPAIILKGGVAIYTQDAIKTNVVYETFEVRTEQAGKVDERVKEVACDIVFTPASEWESAQLAILMPWTNPVIGTSLLTGSDVPTVIHPLNGKEKLSYSASGIFKQPDIMPSATGPMFGPCTLKCMKKNATAWSAADARVTVTATEAFSDTSFAVTNVKNVAYAIALGALSAPWNDLKTRAGTKISSNIQWQPLEVDGEGIVDYTLKSIDYNVRLAFVGPTVAQAITLMKIQGTGAGQGLSLAANANDMTLTGPAVGDPLITAYKAALKGAPQVYGSGETRHGEAEFILTRPNGSGAFLSLASVSA